MAMARAVPSAMAFSEALVMGADVVVMLDADGTYAPS